MKVGSYRRRLARILNASLPVVRGMPVFWSADRIYPALGAWRHVRMDVMSWQAAAHWVDKPGSCCVMAGCWETIGECIKAGRVNISDDGWTIYPVRRSRVMTKDESPQLELPMPERVRVRLGDDEIPAERSRWEAWEDPWTPGWWEVSDQQTGTMQGRWWWNGALWQAYREGAPRTIIPASIFRLRYAWRGLALPSPDIYPCPPYSSDVLLPAAQRAGVGLRTMHAIVTQPQRVRNRL
jgi:hypothetical protein